MDELVSDEGPGLDRKWAILAVVPFFLLGFSSLLLILLWGLDGLWGFMIMPPILFICVLGYIAFRTGFAADRTGDVTGEIDRTE
ncbi:hypothetical protein [Halorientalis halophila]|uniref:hypothetical protein n=1 Tax=Halorientalis halophila TaxID=3108499 RepID=UPI00300BE7EE